MFLPPWHFLNGRWRKATQIYVATFFSFFFFFLPAHDFATALSNVHFYAAWCFRSNTYCTCGDRGDSFMNVPHCPHFVSSHWALASAPSSSINHPEQHQTEEDVTQALSPSWKFSFSPPSLRFSISPNAFIMCFFFHLFFFFFDWWMSQVSILLTTAKFKNTPAKISATASILYTPLIDVRSGSTLV